MSEKTFWQCTPRKLSALLDVHGYFKDPNNKTKEAEAEEVVYIDQVKNF